MPWIFVFVSGIIILATLHQSYPLNTSCFCVLRRCGRFAPYIFFIFKLLYYLDSETEANIQALEFFCWIFPCTVGRSFIFIISAYQLFNYKNSIMLFLHQFCQPCFLTFLWDVKLRNFWFICVEHLIITEFYKTQIMTCLSRLKNFS